VFPALWLHPLENVDTLITFAFYLALVQLTLGCLINIYDELSLGWDAGHTIHQVIAGPLRGRPQGRVEKTEPGRNLATAPTCWAIP